VLCAEKEPAVRILTVTCDGRPAAMIAATDRADAIATALDLAEARNLLGVMAAPRRFEAREPTKAEMAEWHRHDGNPFIFDMPIAA
jgi:hypothetical protein